MRLGNNHAWSLGSFSLFLFLFCQWLHIPFAGRGMQIVIIKNEKKIWQLKSCVCISVHFCCSYLANSQLSLHTHGHHRRLFFSPWAKLQKNARSRLNPGHWPSYTWSPCVRENVSCCIMRDGWIIIMILSRHRWTIPSSRDPIIITIIIMCVLNMLQKKEILITKTNQWAHMCWNCVRGDCCGWFVTQASWIRERGIKEKEGEYPWPRTQQCENIDRYQAMCAVVVCAVER